MFIITGDNKRIEYQPGTQNFNDETVKVDVEGSEIICPMFSDDGDIGFYLEDETFYFKDFKCITLNKIHLSFTNKRL